VNKFILLVYVHDDEHDAFTKHLFTFFLAYFAFSQFHNSGLNDFSFMTFTRTSWGKKYSSETISAQDPCYLPPWIGCRYPSYISRLAVVFRAMQILAQNSALHFLLILISILDCLFQIKPKRGSAKVVSFLFIITVMTRHACIFCFAFPPLALVHTSKMLSHF